jgi:hypothetical protein
LSHARQSHNHPLTPENKQKKDEVSSSKHVSAANFSKRKSPGADAGSKLTENAATLSSASKPGKTPDRKKHSSKKVKLQKSPTVDAGSSQTEAAATSNSSKKAKTPDRDVTLSKKAKLQVGAVAVPKKIFVDPIEVTEEAVTLNSARKPEKTPDNSSKKGKLQISPSVGIPKKIFIDSDGEDEVPLTTSRAKAHKTTPKRNAQPVADHSSHAKTKSTTMKENKRSQSPFNAASSSVDCLPTSPDPLFFVMTGGRSPPKFKVEVVIPKLAMHHTSIIPARNDSISMESLDKLSEKSASKSVVSRSSGDPLTMAKSVKNSSPVAKSESPEDSTVDTRSSKSLLTSFISSPPKAPFVPVSASNLLDDDDSDIDMEPYKFEESSDDDLLEHMPPTSTRSGRATNGRKFTFTEADFDLPAHSAQSASASKPLLKKAVNLDMADLNKLLLKNVATKERTDKYAQLTRAHRDELMSVPDEALIPKEVENIIYNVRKPNIDARVSCKTGNI